MIINKINILIKHKEKKQNNNQNGGQQIRKPPNIN